MLQFMRFVVLRFILAIITLLMVTLIIFTLMELSLVQYTDRCRLFINFYSLTLSLDEPFFIRWMDWVKDVFVYGDFGFSCVLRQPINLLLGTKFWISLGLCLSALLLAYLIAIPVGIYSASANRPGLNNVLRFVSYFGLSIPNFLLALIIILAWSVVYGNVPSGVLSREYQGAAWSYDKFADFLSHVWIPIIVLGWSATAIALQTVRALMLDEFSKPYVMAARGRGLSERQLVWRYPARHALGPMFNSLGYDLNRIFNELPIVALILSLSDAGALLLDSLLRSNDQALAAAILFLLTASVIGLNFVTDVILAIFDPRFRRGLLGSD